MALPQYKMSRANTRTRRSTWKAKAAQTISFQNCCAQTLAHMACQTCGSFSGRVYSEAIRARHSRCIQAVH